MLKLFRSTGLMFILTAFSLSVSLAEDEITISTYYPSPHGVYNQLQTNKLAVGDTDGLGTLDAADQPAQEGDIRLKVYDGDPQADNLEGRSGEILFSSENSGSLFLHNGTGWAAAGGGSGGGGVCYNVFGNNTCAQGYTAVVSGYTAVLYEYSTRVGWGGPFCSPIKMDTNPFVNAAFKGTTKDGMGITIDNLPCAICCK